MSLLWGGGRFEDTDEAKRVRAPAVCGCVGASCVLARGASRRVDGSFGRGPELTRLWCHSRQAVEELVKQRDDLQQASTALQKVIDDQKQVHRF